MPDRAPDNCSSHNQADAYRGPGVASQRRFEPESGTAPLTHCQFAAYVRSDDALMTPTRGTTGDVGGGGDFSSRTPTEVSEANRETDPSSTPVLSISAQGALPRSFRRLHAAQSSDNEVPFSSSDSLREASTIRPRPSLLEALRTFVNRTWRSIRRLFVAKSERSRGLRVTRDGKVYVIITIGIGLVAINTGSNLLYLVLGTLLSLILVSGVMSELTLRGLTIVRRLPKRVHAGQSCSVEIEIFNCKKHCSSYAIEVEDLRAGQPTDKRCFFLKVSPQSSQVAAYRRRPYRRGLYKHTGFRIVTRFPFGLFEKTMRYELPEEMLVYPAITSPRVPSATRDNDKAVLVCDARGKGDDIAGVRPMRYGDDVRTIYWPKSTQPNAWVIKERTGYDSGITELRLDDLRTADCDKRQWASDFEHRIAEIASTTLYLLRRGLSATVITASGKRYHASRSTGADPILRFLALLEPTDIAGESSIRSCRNVSSVGPLVLSGPCTLYNTVSWGGHASGAIHVEPPTRHQTLPSTRRAINGGGPSDRAILCALPGDHR